MYVTNRGYGGVQYALRYGIPIVTSSGQEDKPEVAGRVSWSGVGRRINSETPTPAAVRKAIRTVLKDPRYRDRAQQISRSMAQAGGITGLTQIVDDLASPRLP